jgi:hypothetical protein
VALDLVEGAVGCTQKVFDGQTVAGILGNADADGKTRKLGIFGETLRDALRNPAGVFGGDLGQNQSEFVPAITSGRIDATATDVKNLREAAESRAAHDMAVRVVDLLQSV